MDKDEWIQVDLGRPESVTGVVIQGHPSEPFWVTVFEVYTSVDGETFTPYIQTGEHSATALTANVDNASPVHVHFDREIRARFVRVRPLKWETNIAIRMDIMGCEGTQETPTPSAFPPGYTGETPTPYPPPGYTGLPATLNPPGYTGPPPTPYPPDYTGSTPILFPLGHSDSVPTPYPPDYTGSTPRLYPPGYTGPSPTPYPPGHTESIPVLTVPTLEPGKLHHLCIL